MTLEEQFQKETGISDTLENYSELYKYESTYSKWLEEKLTWKKFSEQKPELGRDILVKNGTFMASWNKIEKNDVSRLSETSVESEWMYAPN